MNAKRIVVVGKPNDPLAGAFCQYARQQGVRCHRAGAEEFARRIRIEHCGQAGTVAPACPLLLRPLMGLPPEADEETRFCHQEVFATVWSAAALTSAPVINRPNEWGWGGKLTLSPVVSEARATGQVSGPEFFWHQLAPEAPVDLLHQDLESWQTVPDPAAVRYVRSRPRPDSRGWEQVIVVGECGFRTSTAALGPRAATLEADSRALAQQFGFCFATISWAIARADDHPVFVRINPFPSWDECAPVWAQVAPALLAYLCP